MLQTDTILSVVYKYFSGLSGMGGDLGGRSPQKLSWVDDPCTRPPNILRSSVCRTRAKARTE